MLEQLDFGDKTLNVRNFPVFDRLNKNASMINQHISDYIQNYFGFTGINYDNLSDIYNPKITGIKTLKQTYNYLV